MYLIEEQELTRQAEEMGRQIVAQAQGEAAEVKRGADNYAAEVLSTLEANLMRTLKSVKLGLELLDGNQPEDGSGVEEGAGEADEYDKTAGKQPIRG
jgi:hypothetical protein